MEYKKAAEELYDNYYNQLRDFMPDTTTTTKILNEVGMQLYPDKYKGTFAYDQIPKRFARYTGFIFNLDKSNEVDREHWVAVYKYKYKKKNRILFYDSFGRSHTSLLPDLQKFYDEDYVHDTDKDAEQHPSSSDCGLRCMAFLSVCFNNGVLYAKHI